jgi:hypothetical protein
MFSALINISKNLHILSCLSIRMFLPEMTITVHAAADHVHCAYSKDEGTLLHLAHLL